MKKNLFKSVACNSENSNWDKLISRENKLYVRTDDIRSPFARDYTRILHSLAYRRLKHKTQVFFNVDNDHICTRMEHVAHVESVSNTIAKYLGLNDELTKAIAFGHDLGHAPFGHQGEFVLNSLSMKYIYNNFWHEKNGLRFVDKIELLEDDSKYKTNLNLTYAVRDGIISHCGEINENSIFPRNELFDLQFFNKVGQFQPSTWEGCAVKVSDKIAYLGRDIEDALNLNFLSQAEIEKLDKLLVNHGVATANASVIMHKLIVDICENSSPEKGLCLSSDGLKTLDNIKQFNLENIYNNSRFNPFIKYSELIISEIFNILYSLYDDKNTINTLKANNYKASFLINEFIDWLIKYVDECVLIDEKQIEISRQCKNFKIYSSLNNSTIYAQSIIDFISGMTDRYAIKCFDSLIEIN